MKTTMKLRLIGGCVLLFNLWLVGHYNLEGISVLLLTLGFAAGYEYLVVRPASKAASQPAVVPVAPAPFCGSMSPSAPPTPLPTTLPKDQLVSIHTALPSKALVENFSSNEGPVEEFWAQALTELEGPGRRPGLWARVFSATQGNENLAKAQYLQERVRELSDVAARRAAADSLERAQANHIAHEKVIRLKQAFLAGSTLKPYDVAYLARGSNMEQSLTELSERSRVKPCCIGVRATGCRKKPPSFYRMAQMHVLPTVTD